MAEAREEATKEAKAWPKVAIIVLNWNGWRDTIECLESLQRITYPNYQVIVVDNGSTDGSVEKIKAWARGEIPVVSKFFEYDSTTKPVQWVEYDHSQAKVGGIVEEEAKLCSLPSNRRLVIILNKDNLGFAAGNNVAIRYALQRGYPYISLLNNDTVVDPAWLTILVSTLQAKPSIGAVGPKIVYKEMPRDVWFAGMKVIVPLGRVRHITFKEEKNRNLSGIKPTDALTGCAFVAKSEVFKENLFDEDYFLVYEDVDFFWKMKRKGIVLAVNLDSKVYHSRGSSFSRLSNTKQHRYTYYYAKNRLLFVKKNGSCAEKAVFFSIYTVSRFPCFLIRLVKGQANSVLIEIQALRDFLFKRWGWYDKQRANQT
jgi:GT2 family glycosyltransferase